MIPFACRASTAIVQTPHSRMVAVTFKPQDLSLNKLQSISVPFIHWISRFFDTAPYEDLLSTGVVIAHKKACKHLPDVYSTKGFPPHLGAFCMRMCPFYRCFARFIADISIAPLSLWIVSRLVPRTELFLLSSQAMRSNAFPPIFLLSRPIPFHLLLHDPVLPFCNSYIV